MNLAKLFEVQKVLRDRINYNEPDRFNKLVLALLVELGECANEQRSWKFWSKQQTPKVYGKFKLAEDGETLIPDPESSYTRVLEEYVDGLHFVLEIGLEIEVDDFVYNYSHTHKYEDITRQFVLVSWFTTQMLEDDFYNALVNSYIELGFMLGFTWEEIEEAYMEKNKVNHQRQEEGY